MAILACGYILVYFSEHLFWAHAKPDNTWLGWILTWRIYSLTGYIFLSAIALFRFALLLGIIPGRSHLRLAD